MILIWLATPDGFYSIAQTRARSAANMRAFGLDGSLTVRARDLESLSRLLSRYAACIPTHHSGGIVSPAPIIQEGGGTDYEFRVELPRRAVRLIAMDSVNRIDYPNFKSATQASRGPAFHDVLVRAWAALLNLNERPGEQWRNALPTREKPRPKHARGRSMNTTGTRRTRQ